MRAPVAWAGTEARGSSTTRSVARFSASSVAGGMIVTALLYEKRPCRSCWTLRLFDTFLGHLGGVDLGIGAALVILLRNVRFSTPSAGTSALSELAPKDRCSPR